MSGELQYYGNPETDTGFTVTAQVYDNAGVSISAPINCSEVGVLSIYIGDMPAAVAGVYGVRFFNGATFLNHGVIEWDGTAEIHLADVGGLTTDQNTQLQESWQLLGLDASNTVTINNASHLTGSINIAIGDDGNGTVTLARS